MRLSFSGFLKGLLAIGGLGAILWSCAPTTHSGTASNKIFISPWELFSFRFSENEAAYIEVLDSKTLQPIPGARVLIGHAVGQPFADNWLITNLQGQVTQPAQWQTELPVTVQASGYLTTTYSAISPRVGGIRLLLSAARPQKPQYELQGTVGGFSVKNGDGAIDFSLTLPLVPKESLFEFSLSSFLSPYLDTVSVLGQEMSVPSNLAFPDQRESYFFSFRLNKPNYRMAFFEPGVYSLVTINGQFPVKPVFDAFRKGGDFADVINHFDMRGLSFDQVGVQGPRSQKDLRVGQVSMGAQSMVRAPRFAQDEVFLLASVGQRPEGVFPIDVRRLGSGATDRLKVLKNDDQVVGLLRKSNELSGAVESERMSVVVGSLSEAQNGSLSPLPLMGALRWEQGQVVLPNYALPAGYYAVGALWKLQAVTQIRDQRTRELIREEKNTLMQIYAPDWPQRLTPPQVPGQTWPAGLKRWSVTLFAARRPTQMRPLQQLDFSTVTHISHNNVDFQ